MARARKKHRMAQLQEENEVVTGQNAKLLEVYERAWVDRHTLLTELLSISKTTPPTEGDLKPLLDKIIKDAHEIMQLTSRPPPLPHPDEFKPKEEDDDAV